MTYDLARATLEAVLDEKQERGEATALARTALDFFTISAASRSAEVCAEVTVEVGG